MKKYLSFFKIRFTASLQYRAAALAGISTQFAWGGMSVLMFWAFYKHDPSAFPMTFSETSSYIWLQQAFLAIFMTWFFDNDIFESITSGSIAYELCRPCDIYTMWFTKTAAVRLSNASLRCFPILIVSALLPEPFGLSFPNSPLSFVLFLASMILGFSVLITYTMLIYISAFYTISPAGIKIFSSCLADFFAGGLIPLPFFPDSLQPILNILPFASIQNTPLLIYSGHLDVRSALTRMSIQLAWTILFLITGKCSIKKAMGRVAVQGG